MHLVRSLWGLDTFSFFFSTTADNLYILSRIYMHSTIKSCSFKSCFYGSVSLEPFLFDSVVSGQEFLLLWAYFKQSWHLWLASNVANVTVARIVNDLWSICIIQIWFLFLLSSQFKYFTCFLSQMQFFAILKGVSWFLLIQIEGKQDMVLDCSIQCTLLWSMILSVTT